jgi:hypothetical protein
MHDARISRQIYALHESAAGVAAFLCRGSDLRAGDSLFAEVYTNVVEQGTKLAAKSRPSRPDKLTRRGNCVVEE